MKEASEGVLKDVLAYTEDLVVSSDTLGLEAGSFTMPLKQNIPNSEGKQFVKVVAWYDNEYSYACQYLRLARAFAKVLGLNN